MYLADWNEQYTNYITLLTHVFMAVRQYTWHICLHIGFYYMIRTPNAEYGLRSACIATIVYSRYIPLEILSGTNRASTEIAEDGRSRRSRDTKTLAVVVVVHCICPVCRVAHPVGSTCFYGCCHSASISLAFIIMLAMFFILSLLPSRKMSS